MLWKKCWSPPEASVQQAEDHEMKVACVILLGGLPDEFEAGRLGAGGLADWWAGGLVGWRSVMLVTWVIVTAVV